MSNMPVEEAVVFFLFYGSRLYHDFICVGIIIGEGVGFTNSTIFNFLISENIFEKYSFGVSLIIKSEVIYVTSFGFIPAYCSY